MGNKASILIADANKSYTECLCRHFAPFDDMIVSECISDGNSVVPKLIEYGADILIMDIVLPGKDGLTVIAEINSSVLPKTPEIFVVTGLCSDRTIRQASILGVSGFFAKPMDPDCLVNRIRNSFRSDSVAEPSFSPEKDKGILLYNLSDIIQRVGIPTHLSGSRYTREAVIIVYYDAKALDDMSALYKNIADMFGTAPAAVERSIRNAVDYMWDKSATNYTERLFDRTLGKPRNTDLITKLTHELRGKILKL